MLDDLEVLTVKSGGVGDKNRVQLLAIVGIKHKLNPTFSEQLDKISKPG